MMETGLVSIEVVSKIYSVSIDIQAVKRRYFVEKELDKEEVQRILRDHGIRARSKRMNTIDELLKYPAPSIILSRDNQYHIFLGKRGKVFIFDCNEKKPKEIDIEEFMQLWNKEALRYILVLQRPNFS